ncbi:MAG: hypothetical protein WDM76_16550 [Limisphaerales bacterium]
MAGHWSVRTYLRRGFAAFWPEKFSKIFLKIKKYRASKIVSEKSDGVRKNCGEFKKLLRKTLIESVFLRN